MSAALKTGADARAMRTTKYPSQFSSKVDMTKVNLPVIKKWVSDEIAKILKTDDDVVTEMIFSILEGSKFPNIKQLQNDVTGFLDKDAAPFCLDLWKLCLSAQADPNGIPKELLEAKKYELIQEKLAEDRAREDAMKRQAEEREREREVAEIRERERNQRGRGGRGGRRGRDRSHERRPPSRESRSPPRRRDPPRGTDSYVPGGRGRRDEPLRRRQRSPSYGRSPSRSRSPPRRRRRRNTSSESSRSPPPRRFTGEGSDREADRNEHKNSRPQDRRRYRSPSPRSSRRSPTYPDGGRSPPRKRRSSPSPSRSPPRRRARDSSSRSRSRSPPSKRRTRLGPDDLMSRFDRTKDNQRLSREGSTNSDASPQRRESGSDEGHNGDVEAPATADDEVGIDG